MYLVSTWLNQRGDITAWQRCLVESPGNGMRRRGFYVQWWKQLFSQQRDRDLAVTNNAADWRLCTATSSVTLNTMGLLLLKKKKKNFTVAVIVRTKQPGLFCSWRYHSKGTGFYLLAVQTLVNHWTWSSLPLRLNLNILKDSTTSHLNKLSFPFR